MYLYRLLIFKTSKVLEIYGSVHHDKFLQNDQQDAIV